jgi:hypothetical protein
MCPAARKSFVESGRWLNTFMPPITARLNSLITGTGTSTSPESHSESPPPPLLTDADVLQIMNLCPFDTAVKGRLSEFCGLFMEREWMGYEYLYDLNKFYYTGYVLS